MYSVYCTYYSCSNLSLHKYLFETGKQIHCHKEHYYLIDVCIVLTFSSGQSKKKKIHIMTFNKCIVFLFHLNAYKS